jgi:hypothetical protein
MNTSTSANIFVIMLLFFLRVFAVPISCMVYFFVRKWYGNDVYGALYYKSETGEWL